MIAIRSKREIALLRQADQIVAEVLTALADEIRPGVTTDELDAIAERMILEAGGTPSFKGYRGFPKSTCISVEAEIVHGIPGDRVLGDNEIVSVDVGVNYKGYYGDAALTVPCGAIDAGRERLLEVTSQALANGIAAARDGNYIEDISRAIEETVNAAGFGIVRHFVGHGIGTEMHEEPQIPNFVSGHRGARLKAGMVLAIEPMVTLGSPDVRVLQDGWTAVTADGAPSAHFEHSIVVNDTGAPEILSASPTRSWGGS